jgi:hypothetical protein
MRVRVPPATPKADLADVVHSGGLKHHRSPFDPDSRHHLAHVAQLDEYEITNLGDAGSSPVVSSTMNAAGGGLCPCAPERLKAQAVRHRTVSSSRAATALAARTFCRERRRVGRVTGHRGAWSPCLPWKEESGGSNPPALTIPRLSQGPRQTIMPAGQKSHGVRCTYARGEEDHDVSGAQDKLAWSRSAAR